MGFRVASNLNLRLPCVALFFAIAAGCSATVPGGLVRGTSQTGSDDANRPAQEITPPHSSAFLGAPVSGPQESVPSQVVTVDYKVTTAQPELPQPKPLPAVVKDQNPHVLKTVEPTLTLDLTVGLSKILQFKDAPKRVQMDSEEKAGIATYKVITEKELSVMGLKPGRTVLNLWFADPKDAANPKLYSYLVRVFPDPQAQVRVRAELEKYYQQLESEINHAFPNSRVSMTVVGSRLVLCGTAHDIFEAAQILRIVAPRTAAGGVQQSAKNATTAIEHGLAQSRIIKMPDAPPDDSDKGDDGTNPYFRGGLQVVNMMRVPGEQQVMLKVVVAEVNRTALRNMGINFSVANGNGIVFTNTTGGILSSGTTTPGGNLLAKLNAGKITLVIDALKQRNLARSLAEPNLTALNGQTAKFHAGGAFPVPVVTGFTAAGLQGVEFIPFGVELAFTPTITDKDRIRLQVNADVSVRDNANSASVGGTTVPSLSKRSFGTVVDLRAGETMAVAGLIQNNYGADSARLPFLGDVPVLGRLVGGSDKTTAGQQELIILITPVLARPLDPHHTRPVPGSDMLEPSDVDFYFGGRLESHTAIDYNSPIRTDLPRMHQYHQELRTNPGTSQGAPAGPPMINNQPTYPKGYIP
jgi:pilus assembly protein CpaC